MFLARKELWFSKRRFFFISFIVLLITWLVFMLAGLGNGLSDLGTAIIRYSEMDVAVFEEEAEYTIGKSTLPEKMVSEINVLDHVDEAAPISTMAGSVLQGEDEDTNKKTSVIFVGVEAGTFVEPAVTEGNALDANELNRVLVNDSLQTEGFKVGDKITVNGLDAELEIAGFVSTQTLNHLPAVYMNIEQLREMKYVVPGSDMGIEEPVNVIFVKGENLDADAITSKIDGVEVGTKKDALNGVPGYKAESGTINLMLWLLIFISAFIVAVFFYVLTTQKVQQFGVMKAIGASNGFVISSVISQVLLLVTISTLIGVALAYLTKAVLPEGMPFNLLPSMVALYSGVIILMSLVGSLSSVRGIVKIDPVTALGRAE